MHYLPHSQSSHLHSSHLQDLHLPHSHFTHSHLPHLQASFATVLETTVEALAKQLQRMESKNVFIGYKKSEWKELTPDDIRTDMNGNLIALAVAIRGLRDVLRHCVFPRHAPTATAEHAKSMGDAPCKDKERDRPMCRSHNNLVCSHTGRNDCFRLPGHNNRTGLEESTSKVVKPAPS